MTVNKDEIRRLDAAKLLEWLVVEIDLSRGGNPTLEADRWAFNEVRKAIERGTFDSPPDVKDAEIERLRAELCKHRNAAELALTGQRAAEQERDELKREIADGGPLGRNYTNQQFNDLQKERDRLEKRMKSYELRALRNAVTCDELRQELDNEKKVALHHEGRADKSYHEILRLRQQNADLLEAWVWVDEIRDSEPVMDEWHEAYAFRSVEERARTILDRYKDAQPCKTCGGAGGWHDGSGPLAEPVQCPDCSAEDAQPECSAEEPCLVCAEGLEIYDRMAEDTQEGKEQ